MNKLYMSTKKATKPPTKPPIKTPIKNKKPKSQRRINPVTALTTIAAIAAATTPQTEGSRINMATNFTTVDPTSVTNTNPQPAEKDGNIIVTPDGRVMRCSNEDGVNACRPLYTKPNKNIEPIKERRISLAPTAEQRRKEGRKKFRRDQLRARRITQKLIKQDYKGRKYPKHLNISRITNRVSRGRYGGTKKIRRLIKKTKQIRQRKSKRKSRRKLRIKSRRKQKR